MKETWQILAKDWATFNMAQKIGWILFFWVLFPILWVAVKYGKQLDDRNTADRKELIKRRAGIATTKRQIEKAKARRRKAKIGRARW